MPVRGPSGVFLLFATVGVSAFGFWRLGQGNVERRYVLPNLTFSELARERAWSRIYLTPLLLAVSDRDMFRRDRASALRENLLMKDVPNWEVCTHCDPLIRAHTLRCFLPSVTVFLNWFGCICVMLCAIQAGKSVYNSKRYTPNNYVVM